MNLEQLKRKYMAEGFRRGWKKYIKEAADESVDNSEIVAFLEKLKSNIPWKIKSFETKRNYNDAIIKFDTTSSPISQLWMHGPSPAQNFYWPQLDVNYEIRDKSREAYMQVWEICSKRNRFKQLDNAAFKKMVARINDIDSVWQSVQAKMQPQQSVAVPARGKKAVSAITGDQAMTPTILRAALIDGADENWDHLLDMVESSFLKELGKMFKERFGSSKVPSAWLNSDNYMRVAPEAIEEEKYEIYSETGDAPDFYEVVQKICKETKMENIFDADGEEIFISRKLFNKR